MSNVCTCEYLKQLSVSAGIVRASNKGESGSESEQSSYWPSCHQNQFQKTEAQNQNLKMVKNVACHFT